MPAIATTNAVVAGLQVAEVLYQLVRVPAPATTQALLAAQDRRHKWRNMDAVYSHMRATGMLPLAPAKWKGGGMS